MGEAGARKDWEGQLDLHPDLKVFRALCHFSIEKKEICPFFSSPPPPALCHPRIYVGFLLTNISEL